MTGMARAAAELLREPSSPRPLGKIWMDYDRSTDVEPGHGLVQDREVRRIEMRVGDGDRAESTLG